MSNFRHSALQLLAVLLLPLGVVAEIPDGIQGNFRRYFAEKEFLLQGGTAICDDCVIAVGSAAYNPERADIMRSVALADANSNLIILLYGAVLDAKQSVSEEVTQKNEKFSSTGESRSVFRSAIKNSTLGQSQVCGEWVSADQRTYFVALAKFFDRKSGVAKAADVAGLPPFLTDFQPFGNWRNALLSVRGILRGGAALYLDEYGEEYLICAASAPQSLPYSQQLQMLQIKAGTEAVGYVNGNLINDQHYLEENLKISDSNTSSSTEAELVNRHIQTSVRQGAIRRITPIGSWKISDMPNRVFRGFVLRLSDIAAESFPVIPAGADEKSDTVEIDTADDSGKRLTEALKNAEFYEKDDEISVVVPDDSPLFGKDENEIELSDPLQIMPAAGVALQPAANITPASELPIPQININQVNIAPDINVNINNTTVAPVLLRRSFIPVRVYRKAPHKVPKRIVLHRHRHFHKHYKHRSLHPRFKHHPPAKFKKMPHPPKFRIRTPRPGYKPMQFRKSPHRSVRRSAAPPRGGHKARPRRKR